MAPGALIEENAPIGNEIGTGTSVNPPPPRTIWPPLELEEHPIDEFRSIRVIVVGAGLSGITSGILLPAKVPNIELTIYERNNDVVRHSIHLNLLAV